jgi:asparagine synthase (glutamine-hydrolysing)
VNGILGYLRLDGAPLAGEKLRLMQAAMAYWGVDGAAGWHDTNAALGCQFTFCTPEETEGWFPYVDTQHGWVLTAGAFLNNREELLQELGILGAEARELPDSLLIHRSYVRWGEDCVHHLLGDWHFALWDIRARRLFLARDHCGNTGVCYTQGPGFFAFASGRKALLALTEVPQVPNLLRLAQILTSWQGDGVQTAYAGMHRLPPAHCLRLVDEQVRIERYWSPENAPELSFAREADCLEAFLEQYDRAVRARLRSPTPVSATLSGGLDSGSVCTLAAKALAGRGQRLAAFTWIPLEDTTPYNPKNRLGDESDLARASAQQAGNIDLSLFTAAEVSPLAGIQRLLEIHDEPGHAAANYFWIVALLAQVRGAGGRVLLTGQGGNLTVSWSGVPANLWPLLRPGKLHQFRRQFLELQERHGLSVWGGLKGFLAWPLVGPWRQRWQYATHPGPPFLAYSAINPDFSRFLNLARRMQAQGHDPFFRTVYDPQKVRAQRVGALQSWLGASWGESSGAYGLEVRDPTLDQRLWEFCLGLPDSYHAAEGQNRAVLRRAFRGLLPEAVRLNRRRGLQAADICRRVRSQAGEIEEVLGLLEKHPLARAVLDLPRLRRVLGSIQEGSTVTNTGEAVTILLRGLGVGMFLVRF